MLNIVTNWCSDNPLSEGGVVMKWTKPQVLQFHKCDCHKTCPSTFLHEHASAGSSIASIYHLSCSVVYNLELSTSIFIADFRPAHPDLAYLYIEHISYGSILVAQLCVWLLADIQDTADVTYTHALDTCQLTCSVFLITA
jgi:hypothetical protein